MLYNNFNSSRKQAIHTASFVALVVAIYFTLVDDNATVFYLQEDYETCVSAKVNTYPKVEWRVFLSPL